MKSEPKNTKSQKYIEKNDESGPGNARDGRESGNFSEAKKPYQKPLVKVFAPLDGITLLTGGSAEGTTAVVAISGGGV